MPSRLGGFRRDESAIPHVSPLSQVRMRRGLLAGSRCSLQGSPAGSNILNEIRRMHNFEYRHESSMRTGAGQPDCERGAPLLHLQLRTLVRHFRRLMEPPEVPL